MTNRVDRSRTPSRTSAGPYRDPSWPGVVGTYCDPPTVARSVEFASSTLEFGGIAPCSTIVPSSDVTFVMLTRACGIKRAVLSPRPPIRSCAPPASTQWRSVTFSASANASIKRRSTATVIGPLNTTESKHAVARQPPTVTDSVSVTPLTQPSAASPPPPPALAGGTSNGRHASPTPPARQLHMQSENDAVSTLKHASAAAQPSHGTTLTEGRPAMRYSSRLRSTRPPARLHCTDTTPLVIVGPETSVAPAAAQRAIDTVPPLSVTPESDATDDASPTAHTSRSSSHPPTPTVPPSQRTSDDATDPSTRTKRSTESNTARRSPRTMPPLLLTTETFVTENTEWLCRLRRDEDATCIADAVGPPDASSNTPSSTTALDSRSTPPPTYTADPPACNDLSTVLLTRSCDCNSEIACSTSGEATASVSPLSWE
ncbi:hypothetical protein ECC02_010655 [Trypanosoma cruzi]|uniref:Uncharacterized protein n=1 Tax=Trypanosoma cruzi TaxID=5693 RepID=A0A7J6XQ07_TRYCR|nr:hypothetical protein ECC02_010655 [Trypanosoma cruzi]